MNKLGLLAPLLAIVAAASGCTSDGNSDATLTVTNKSDFSIVELYVTQVDNPDWGRNLLGGDELLPDEHTTLGVACDFYDAKLIDEDNVDCEVHDLDLCANDADWVIRNNTCPVFGAARAAREAAAKALGK
jgi:hypothetical protein